MEELTLPAHVPASCPFPAACPNSEVQPASSRGQWCGPLCVPTLGTCHSQQSEFRGAWQVLRLGVGLGSHRRLGRHQGSLTRRIFCSHCMFCSWGPCRKEERGLTQAAVSRAPWWLSGKDPPASAGDSRDAGLISGPGRSPGEGNGNPLQYSCLENSMDRGA